MLGGIRAAFCGSASLVRQTHRITVRRQSKWCRLGGRPMGDERASVQPVSEWLQASLDLGRALEGLTEDDLNLTGGPDGWSIRENVHHMVESNLAACTIVIAAVGTRGY